MAKNPKPKPEDKDQSQRFIDTAKQLEADESGETFVRALGVVVPPKKPEPEKQP